MKNKNEKMQEKENGLRNLEPYSSIVSDVIETVLEDNGLVTNLGEIKVLGNPIVSGFIPGVSISCEDESNDANIIEGPVLICNTIDEGFRFCAPTKDKSSTKDLGPVNTACMIGNNKGSKSILIPIESKKAVADGIKILELCLDMHKNLEDDIELCEEYENDYDDNVTW